MIREVIFPARRKCVSDVTDRVMAFDLLPMISPMGMTDGGPITVTVK